MVSRVLEQGWSLAAAAEAAGVSERDLLRSGSRATGPRARRAAGSVLGAAAVPHRTRDERVEAIARAAAAAA